MRRSATARTGVAPPAALLGVFFVLVATAARGWSATAERAKVLYGNDRLSVHAERVPLHDVLEAFAKASGAEICGSPRESRDVTIEMKDVPLSEALRRLLGDQNFTLSYGEAGRLRALELVAPSQPGDVPAAVDAWGLPAAAFAAFERHVRVPLDDRLATALGTQTATLAQLFTTGLRHHDPDVRAAAIGTWLRTFEEDRELRANVLHLVGSMDDMAVMRVLRGVAGRRADELLARIAGQAQDSDLRTKASSLLEQLRAAPADR